MQWDFLKNYFSNFEGSRWRIIVQGHLQCYKARSSYPLDSVASISLRLVQVYLDQALCNSVELTHLHIPGSTELLWPRPSLANFPLLSFKPTQVIRTLLCLLWSSYVTSNYVFSDTWTHYSVLFEVHWTTTWFEQKTQIISKSRSYFFVNLPIQVNKIQGLCINKRALVNKWAAKAIKSLASVDNTKPTSSQLLVSHLTFRTGS